MQPQLPLGQETTDPNGRRSGRPKWWSKPLRISLNDSAHYTWYSARHKAPSARCKYVARYTVFVHLYFNRDWDEVQKDLAQYIVPTAVPAFPFRFRDNMVGAAIGEVPIEALQSLYTKLYDLKLQQEGWGEALTTLESHLHIDRSTGRVQVALKNKLVQNAGDQRRALVRYPDWYAPNAKSVLHSLVPALVQKCVYYSTSLDIMRLNIEGTLRELTRKGYPGMWWKPAFKRTMRQQKVPQSVVKATHEGKYWRLAGNDTSS